MGLFCPMAASIEQILARAADKLDKIPRCHRQAQSLITGRSRAAMVSMHRRRNTESAIVIAATDSEAVLCATKLSEIIRSLRKNRMGSQRTLFCAFDRRITALDSSDFGSAKSRSEIRF